MGSCNSLKLLLKIRWRSTFNYKVSYQVLSWVLHQRRIQKPYYMTQEALWENILRRVFIPCHVCYACQHANMQKAWKLLNFTCQRAKKTCHLAKGVPIFQLSMPTCERLAYFSTWRANVPKGVPIFLLFFKWKSFSIFEFFNYA